MITKNNLDILCDNCHNDNNKSKINKNSIEKSHLEEYGVTLVSLVVTIVVLLILSGITIKFALSDNGIIKQSTLASEKYKNSSIQEQMSLNDAINAMRSSSSSSSDSGSNSGDGDKNTDDLIKQIEDLQNQVNDLNGQINNLKTKQATGNATTAQVLSGATFSTSAEIGLTGTMKNNGAWISSSSGSGKVYIPAGYHNGSGYVDLAGSYNTGYNAGKTGFTTLTGTISKSGMNHSGGSSSITVGGTVKFAGIVSMSCSYDVWGGTNAGSGNSVSISYSGSTITCSMNTSANSGLNSFTCKVIYVLA